ncbi:MAG: hypothetical protein Solivirus1_47 [Solivirus sp.]|uniref:Uncharacterized protein n=1 Tax=Solivirus sp. TaxID=2487772 RepID=A0A3G5AFC2_9VIRU|nr:MAG: hypothetical protein Solivirus1_47 [Solivirus sp.]
MATNFSAANSYREIKELCRETNCFDNEKLSEQIFESYARAHFADVLKYKPYYMNWKKFVKAVDHLLRDFSQLTTNSQQQRYIEELIQNGHFVQVDILTLGPDPLVDGIDSGFHRELYEFQRDHPLALFQVFNAHKDAFHNSWKELFQRLYLLLKNKEEWNSIGVESQEFINQLARDGNIVEIDMLSILPRSIDPAAPLRPNVSLRELTKDVPDYESFDLA